MNVLSLFNGMSCGMLALQKAGIKVDKYYSSEIDKYANKVSQKNFPEIIQIGDVTKVSGFDYDVDLLIAGSPCQGFSFAGKQLNFEDPRSKLFFDFLRILEQIRIKNPKVLFLLENVKMKQEYQDVISESLGVNPIEINSALVSAQNRKRLYWTNIPGVKQPKDRGIVLRDILECRESNYGADRIVGRKINPLTGKRDDYNSRIPTVQRFEFNSDVNKTDCITTVEKDNILKPFLLNRINSSQDGKVVSVEGKSFCHTAGNNNQPKIHLGYFSKEHSEKPRVIRNTKSLDKKSFCMTSTMWKGSQSNGMTNVHDGFYYRKLTPVECERLQTVPDNFTDCVSNSQRYKMLGNGWTVDVIAHIFKNIGQKPKRIDPEYKKQLALF